MALASKRTARRSFLRRLAGQLVIGGGGMRPIAARSDVAFSVEYRVGDFTRRPQRS